MAKESSSSSPADKAKQVARDNGIANPSALVIGPIFAPMYLALVPVTSYLTRPNSIVQSAVKLTLSLIPGLPHPLPARNQIPALAALYLFITFGASGAFSAAGQAMARKEGLDNNEPRTRTGDLRGLPGRLRAAHLNLMENFPAFAVAASLVVGLGKGGDEQLGNLLGLHVLLKCFVYYGAYIADIPPPRTLAHLLATASVINVCWRLATS